MFYRQWTITVGKCVEELEIHANTDDGDLEILKQIRISTKFRASE